jgi:hypothetical protein
MRNLENSENADAYSGRGGVRHRTRNRRISVPPNERGRLLAQRQQAEPSQGIGLRRAEHGPAVVDLLRPTVDVLNAGAVVRVRLDRKGTSAGAGECRLLAQAA